MTTDADEDEGKVEHLFTSVHFPQMSEIGPAKIQLYDFCAYTQGLKSPNREILDHPCSL